MKLSCRTLTPIVLDRHLKKKDAARQEEMADQIASTCRNSGLAGPEMVVCDKHASIEGRTVGDMAVHQDVRACRFVSSSAMAQLPPTPFETLATIDRVGQTLCYHRARSRLGYQGAAALDYRSNPFAIDDEDQTGNSQDLPGRKSSGLVRRTVGLWGSRPCSSA